MKTRSSFIRFAFVFSLCFSKIETLKILPLPGCEKMTLGVNILTTKEKHDIFDISYDSGRNFEGKYKIPDKISATTIPESKILI